MLVSFVACAGLSNTRRAPAAELRVRGEAATRAWTTGAAEAAEGVEEVVAAAEEGSEGVGVD